MKKKLLSLFSLLIVLSMLLSAFAACSPDENGTDETSGTTETESSTQASTDAETSSDTETDSSSETDSTQAETDSETDSESDQATDSETETEVDDNDDVVQAEGVFGPTITYANSIANSVQAYNSDSSHNYYTVENLDMQLQYRLNNALGAPQVTAIVNSEGNSYITETMDAFIRMEGDDNYYYSSSSSVKARTNIYRLGYYYYDVHFLDQNFLGDYTIGEGEYVFNVKDFEYTRDCTVRANRGTIRCVINGGDPFFYTSTSKTMFSTEDYNAISITLSTTGPTGAKLYYVAGDETTHNNDQMSSFSLNNDGEEHTYTIYLGGSDTYKGDFKGLRFDFEDGKIGDEINVTEIKAVKIETNAPNILLDRTFHTYPDKLHQALHFVALEDTTGIAEMGMKTEIDASTVEKLVIKDKDGLKYSLDGVDFATAEYVGFDIKDAGIFGYILADHENSGTLTVTLEDGKYVIIQSSTPENGTLFAPVDSMENDYFMGHRIYTDENHTFDEFISAATFERDPNLGIQASMGYLGYDALRGAFSVNIPSTGFNPPFFYEWNHHYATEVTVKNREGAKQIYIRADATQTCLEGAAIIDENMMMLPIPVEVSKNFGSENEEPIFDCDDTGYSETVFPLYLEENSHYEFTILNLYQNWGNSPIKQLSSIQYFQPYYHLSVGVTETTCIAPWSLWTLRDFRAVSGVYWHLMEGSNFSNQPQHTHGGFHYFLEYTDSEGNYSCGESTSNVIHSSGPTYADVEMSYVSSDGKMSVVYTHTEFPQMDELRALYEIEYYIHDDISFEDFKNNFAFYTFTGWNGYYQSMGYLNENNEIVQTEGSHDKEAYYITLGDKNPYVSLYNMAEYNIDDEPNNVNLGIAIHSSEIMLDGNAYDGNFVLRCEDDEYSLTLDLGDVTLKAGDTISLNMVVSAWGSHLSTDDSNMQKIRLDTCVNPLTVEVEEGEKMESVYVPSVYSNDGKTAQFTLSGGADNVAVRVYGFDTLSAPVIKELVNGDWVDYVISSASTPDLLGHGHYYDGYTVYYDEATGEYSYAFVVDMTDDEGNNLTRTFKIEVDGEFEPWPEEKDPGADEESPLDVYVSPSDILINTNMGAMAGIGSAELSNDMSYITFTSDGKGGTETYANMFKQDNLTDKVVTGQYLVVKYRMPATNVANNNFQFFLSTENTGANGSGDNFTLMLTKDGEWHVAVVDVAALKLPAFKASNDGLYYANYLRFDFFNVKMSENDSLDIAYLGLSDNLDDILELNNDMEKLVYVSSKNPPYGSINVETGKITAAGEAEAPESYVDPDNEQGYTESEVPYGAGIDYVNGLGAYGAYAPFAGKGSGSKQGIGIVDHDNAATVEGTYYLCFAGWCIVEGGIEKYVWSADGGKTWHDAELYNKSSLGTAGEGIISTAEQRAGVEKGSFADYASGGSFQGATGTPSGIAADLSAYMDETVSVTFAAVPKTDTDSLCIVLHVINVQVPDENGEYEGAGSDNENVSYEGVESDYIKNDNYLKATVPFAACADSINGTVELAAQQVGSVNATPKTIALNDTTVSGSSILYFSGWCLVAGGAEKYMWSADGGVTWNDAFKLNDSAFGTSGDAIIEAAIARSGYTQMARYAANSNFQSSQKGIAADLSAYSGQTVDVIFAAVPTWAPDTLCLIYNITGVQVN